MSSTTPSSVSAAPANIDAEQCVIGAVLVDGKALSRIQDIIVPEDFYLDSHRRIFGAMKRLAQDGIDIDVITVADALTVSNQAELTGGLSYLGQIVNATPSSANIVSYANIVKSRSQARKFIEHAAAVASAAQSLTGDVTEALTRLNGFQTVVSASNGLLFPKAFSLAEIHLQPKPVFDYVLPSLLPAA
jgi:replicative DNA helicase